LYGPTGSGTGVLSSGRTRADASTKASTSSYGSAQRTSGDAERALSNSVARPRQSTPKN
jgi:hypothetical protein